MDLHSFKIIIMRFKDILDTHLCTIPITRCLEIRSKILNIEANNATFRKMLLFFVLSFYVHAHYVQCLLCE